MMTKVMCTISSTLFVSIRRFSLEVHGKRLSAIILYSMPPTWEQAPVQHHKNFSLRSQKELLRAKEEAHHFRS